MESSELNKYVTQNPQKVPAMNVIGKDASGTEIDKFRAPRGFQLEKFVMEKYPEKIIQFSAIPSVDISNELRATDTLLNRRPAGIRVRVFTEIARQKDSVPNEPEMIYEGLYDYASELPKPKRV